MADLRMPEGLNDCERQQWLEDLGRQLVEETGQPSGVIDQHVPGGLPVWGMWWTDEPNPATEEDDSLAHPAAVRPATPAARPLHRSTCPPGGEV